MNKHAIKIELKKLSEENNITKISNNIMTLMMITIDHGLIDRELVMSEAKEVGVKNPVGRPRKYPKKENTSPNAVAEPGNKLLRDPKYDRLIGIRNKPVTVKLTNMETGEIKIYKPLYSAIRETKHCWRYLESRDGKVDDGFKIEILNSEKPKFRTNQGGNVQDQGSNDA